MKNYVHTYITVDYSDLEDEVKAAYGHEWSFCEDMESGNDVDHAFEGIDGLPDKYDESALDEFKKTGKPTFYMAREMLNSLCRDGRIESGDYLIRVSW